MAVACLGTATLLASCSLPPVKAAVPAKANSAACRKVASAWPAKVSGLDAYPVNTPSDAVRAWGDRPEKAIIARCGLSMPGPSTDACTQVDGVDWVQRKLDDGYEFTTYGRDPAVQVLIPNDLGTAPLFLPAFTAAAEKIPQGTHRCS